MRVVVAILIAVVGIIHLLPLIGVLGIDRINAMYGVSIVDTNLAILMQHRAALFGLLGGFLVYASFRQKLQSLAIIAGLISVLSFLAIAYGTGGYNPSINMIVIADLVALACLLIAAILRIISRPRRNELR